MESLFAKLAETNLDDISTDYPILAPGMYEFKVETAELKTSERTGGEYLQFGVSLVSAGAQDVNGNALTPGYKLRHMINLTPSQKQIDAADGNVEEVEKKIFADLCRFLDAIQGHRAWDPSLESYLNLQFFAKTKVGKERVDENTGVTYAAGTEFSSFIPKETAPDETDTSDTPY